MTDKEKIKVLKDAIKYSIRNGPPTNYDDEGSIGMYTCCHESELHAHRDDCWYTNLCKALDTVK